GLAGLTVVLDGGETARTDFLGRFEFPFVTPGQHTIAIEPAALPRGVTPDVPFVTLAVSGGQTASAILAVSASASIAGHVFATGSDGAQMPVAGVGVELDGNRRVTTGANGEYGFGRLAPGPHALALIESTFPAGFAVVGGLTRSVTAELGRATSLDFVGEPLGSVSGLVLIPGENGAPPQPVPNAYVLAQPGDHAAITDDAGAFLIDGLPAGSYALELDETTLPENLSGGDKRTLTLATGERVEDVRLALEPRARDIDFSFNGSQTTVLQVALADPAVPPGGSARIAVFASAPVDAVEAEALGRTFPLAADDRRHWRGEVLVPFGTPDGALDVVIRSGSLAQHASLAVNATLPLVTLQTTPANPAPGSYAVVRARFAAPARKDDRIRWQDGAVTTLGAPLAGRVFAFSVKISELPFSGVLSCAGEKVPIVIRGRAATGGRP
ncbi:MAG: carboxypeptidase regulatory-like domain-containing protein, partial [Candidatus Eremiobacteraeota bacterium]|nr:carboxypeptidase regulatory-like domain-containing protein [Candidatus Eremiobacteraeota bacterium]